MFPQLFESVPDAMIVVDGQGRIVMANANAERLFGYARGELRGGSVEQLMPENVRDRHRGYRNGYVARPRVRPMGQYGMNLIGQRKDGAQFPIDIALSPIRTRDGMRFLASIRDISETQRARQALARARYDAAVARVGQIALMSQAGDAVFDPLPRLLADTLEVPTAAVVLMQRDEPVVRAAVGLPEDRVWADLLKPALLRTLQTQEPLLLHELEAEPSDSPAVASSGAIVPLHSHQRAMGALVVLSAQPRRFDHDAMQLLQTVANLVAAVVQRRATEERLAHAQRLEAVGQLTGGVAHDFNNLLTVMSGNLQLLECQYEVLPGAQDIIRSALRSVERGSELTSKLLAFARKQHLSPRAIDPEAMLRDLELLLRSTIGDAIRLDVSCPGGLPWVFADPSQLDSALVNLALNARDAMPGGGALSIDAGERWLTADAARPECKAGQYVAFRVADSGHGMEPAVLARVFEPFFTTKSGGRGSGLGLSMVYGFAQQSGGQVRIDSKSGGGTRVELFLPVSCAAPEPAPAPEAASAPRGAEKVLVVEDDADVRRVATGLLRALGYEVISAADATDGLAHLRRCDDIDLLFSDVMLGAGMNGIALARAATTMRPGLRVVLTSGYDDPAMAAQIVELSYELLRKPYGREQLAAAVRRNLTAAVADGPA